MESVRGALAEVLAEKAIAEAARKEAETLDLCARDLSSISLSSRMTALRTLVLSHNHVSALEPGFFPRLPMLQTLVAVNTGLSSLPPDLGSCSRLSLLDLRWNAIEELPPGLLSSLSHSLTGLRVSYNALHSIPDELRDLTAVEELVMDGNPLTSLPSLEGMTQLRMLAMSRLGTFSHPPGRRKRGHRFKSMPEGIETCTSLEKLYCVHNQLEEFPVALCALTSLRHLYLSGNLLSGPFPPELSGLTNLIQLELSDNPLSRHDLNSLHSAASSLPAYTGTVSDHVLNVDRTEDKHDSRSLQLGDVMEPGLQASASSPTIIESVQVRTSFSPSELVPLFSCDSSTTATTTVTATS